MNIFDKLKDRIQIRDRVASSSILAAGIMDYLKKDERKNIMIFGIPRGGIIVADSIARKLKTENLDILIPRKLATPHNKENAFGAIMEDGVTTMINDRIVEALSISSEYIEQEKVRQLQEVKRRALLYRGSDKLLDYSNKINNSQMTVVLVDDGAASGATLIVSARWIRERKEHKFKKLIIAVPVAPKDTASVLEKECDHLEIITKASSSKFQSVSQYFKDFNPIDDKQVIEILKKWN
jgi:predicted phosphoribosyltransferase